MSQASNGRIQKRLDAKARKDQRDKAIAGMSMLQRYILNGLEKRKISHSELIEMSVYYVTSELEKTLSADPHQTTDRTIQEVKQLLPNQEK